MSPKQDDGRQTINVHDAHSIQITVPLGTWAEELIERALARHIASCPVAPRMLEVERRAERIEVSFARLIGYMVGSGLLSGGAVVAIGKLVH